MSSVSFLPEGLANELWLRAENAVRLTYAADTASRALDGHVRAALQAGFDAEKIAADAFLDVDLVRTIGRGGSAAEFFRDHTPDDKHGE